MCDQCETIGQYERRHGSQEQAKPMSFQDLKQSLGSDMTFCAVFGHCWCLTRNAAIIRPQCCRCGEIDATRFRRGDQWAQWADDADEAANRVARTSRLHSPELPKYDAVYGMSEANSIQPIEFETAPWPPERDLAARQMCHEQTLTYITRITEAIKAGLPRQDAARLVGKLGHCYCIEQERTKPADPYHETCCKCGDRRLHADG